MARILVIDDDEAVLATIRLILEKAKHEVRELAERELSVESLSRDAIDLVITDLLMPDQDGIEIIKGIAKLPNAPPILAISGGGSSGSGLYLRAAEILGAADTLQKPFTGKNLLAKVEMLLKRRKAM